MFSDAILEPLQETFAYKGCKITAQKKVSFSENLALLAGFFGYWCYYPHWLKDALSSVCGVFTCLVNDMELCPLDKLNFEDHC